MVQPLHGVHALWNSLAGNSSARWPAQRADHRALRSTSPAGAGVLA